MVNKIWYSLLVYMSACRPTDVEGGFKSCKAQNVSYVDVCDSKSLTGSTVYLSSTILENDRPHGNDKKCICTVQSTGEQEQAVYMGISPKNDHFYGCQYQLDLGHIYRTVQFGCHINRSYTFNTVRGDVIYMALVPGVKPKHGGGFAFCLNISTTQGSGVTLACNDAITTDRPTSTHSISEVSTTTPASSTSKVPSTTTNTPTSSTSVVPSTTTNTPTSSTSKVPSTTTNTPTSSTSGVPSTTTNTPTSSTSGVPSTTTNTPTSSTSGVPISTRNLYGIVGGSVTGVFIIIIVIIIIVVCLIRKRNLNNREKETGTFDDYVNITNISHLQTSHTDAEQQYEDLNNLQFQPEYAEPNNITNISHLQTSHTDAEQQYEDLNNLTFQPEYAEPNNITNISHLQMSHTDTEQQYEDPNNLSFQPEYVELI